MAWSTNWPASAKLNLFLHVTGRRNDGYHLLQTVFQFIDLSDSLDFEPTADRGIELVTPIPGIEPEADLVTRAARGLQAATGTNQGARIRIQKHLPIGGGLGGGSSDAATVLVALNQLWETGLTPSELAQIGLALGADVPIFVHGCTAWAEGVGEQLQPFDAAVTPAVIINPNVQVNTGRVFSDSHLTRNTPTIKMHAFSLGRSRNDCEPVTRRLYPEVGEALDWLGQFATARMSGTGASVFACVEEPEEAASIVARVPSKWRADAVRRLNRSPLLDRLTQ